MEIRVFEKRSRVYRLRRSILVCLLAILTLVGKVESWDELSRNERTNSSRPEETLINFFAKSFDPVNIVSVSEKCRRDAAIYRKALDRYEAWAMQMFDASTKIPEGLITGNTKQLGHYDECLRIRTDYGFIGKACSPRLKFDISSMDEGREDDDLDVANFLIKISRASGLKNWTSGFSVPYEWLWCVPSTCSPQDIAKTIDAGLSVLKKPSRVNFTITIDENSCDTIESDRPGLDLADWIYISLLSLLVSLVVISTIYDLIKLRKLDKPDPKDTRYMALSSFSAYSNGKWLLSTDKGPTTIPCLDGLRFISICWIIYSHTYYQRIVGVELDLLPVARMHENWLALLILNGNIATDTFLLLSGILLATGELVRKEKRLGRFKFSILNLYMKRYLRLTPAYAIVIGFYATLFYKIGSGPRWHSVISENQANCRASWWTNLLYINNYVNLEQMCMTHSWYLSVDSQLLWLSPIVLYPMLGNGKRSQVIFFVVLSLAFAASILTPFFITFYHNLTGTMLYYKKQIDVRKVYVEIYLRVYARASPYLLGIGLGYLLKKVKPSTIKISTPFVIIGWLLGIAVGFAVILGPRGMYYPEYQYNNLEAAFYGGLHRPAYAMAVGWVVVACVFGFAGPVGKLLSWKLWGPLSTLTYPIYLTHFIALLYDAGTVRTPSHLTIFNVTQAFFGNLMITIGFALALSLCVEIPLVRLISLLFSKSPGDLKTSGKAVISSEFETSQSSFEIYHSYDETPSTVSRTYGDLLNSEKSMSVRSKWRKKTSGSLSEPSTSCTDETSSAYSEPSYVRNKNQFDGWAQKYRT